MKVSELEGAKLDYWVAKAEGKKIRIIPNGLHPYGDNEAELFFPILDNGDMCAGGFDPDLEVEYSPSSDWSQGGPIIEREEIKLREGVFEKWHANLKSPYYKFGMSGPTALIAAMRALVASRFGPEVDDR